jgi:hypothetical protein
MYTRWKTIAGKKRRYLVESYRDEKGRPRQRHIAYVDLWTEDDIKKLVGLHEKFRAALASVINPSGTKADMQKAADLAAKCQKDIATFQGVMECKMRKVRYYSDARVGPDRTKKPNWHERIEFKNPYSYFFKLRARAAYDLSNLREKVKLFHANPKLLDGNPKYGAFRILKEHEPDQYAEMKRKIQALADDRAQEVAALHELLRKLS